MGFALWLDEDLAWAAGTSEYRAMGAAVISRTDLFRPADFRGSRRLPPAPPLRYAGHFASLGQINAWLTASRRVGRLPSLPATKSPKPAPRSTLPAGSPRA